jgi:hypothetical protein
VSDVALEVFLAVLLMVLYEVRSLGEGRVT